jgi:hypothetical protein
VPNHAPALSGIPCLGHRCTTGWVVAVEILQADKQCSIPFGRGQDVSLERREQRGQLRVGALRHSLMISAPLAASAAASDVAGVRRSPHDTLRQGCGLASRHHLDRMAKSRQP